MKIHIHIECDDEKEAARTMQALANRIQTAEKTKDPQVSASTPKKPAKTIVEPQKHESYPPLLTPDTPAEAEETPEPVEVRSQGAHTLVPADKPWTKKFPDGCRHCGTKEKNHMGKGLCTTCYFPHRGEYA